MHLISVGRKPETGALWFHSSGKPFSHLLMCFLMPLFLNLLLFCIFFLFFDLLSSLSLFLHFNSQVLLSVSSVFRQRTVKGVKERVKNTSLPFLLFPCDHISTHTGD